MHDIKVWYAKAHFMGTLENWENVLSKAKNLKKYAVTEEWGHYIEGLLPVLAKFIDTYNGNVDEKYWDHIMDINMGAVAQEASLRIYLGGF